MGLLSDSLFEVCDDIDDIDGGDNNDDDDSDEFVDVVVYQGQR